MFRRTKVKKSEELLKIEEDVWHIIIAGVREGSKAIDQGLKLSIDNWDKIGLLSNEFGNSVSKENTQWKVVDNKSILFRVFTRASDVANMTKLPVGKDGELVAELRGVDWLEKFILQAHLVSDDSIISAAMYGENEARKSDRHKGKRPALESNNEEVSVKIKKKKKTKLDVSGTQSKRKTRTIKNDDSAESKSFLFELEQLELEDHMEVSRH